MIAKAGVVVALMLAIAIPSSAGNDKKKHEQRGLLEKMEAVPCGAKEKGITGLGTIWASAGVTHVNSDEKLCPQYVLRTDEMDYHIRPRDGKHPVVLPVGQEVEFKIKNDNLYLKATNGDKKTRTYQVVAMEPASTDDHKPSAERRDP